MENEIVTSEEVILDVDTTVEAPVAEVVAEAPVEEVSSEEVSSEAPCCEA